MGTIRFDGLFSPLILTIWGELSGDITVRKAMRLRKFGFVPVAMLCVAGLSAQPWAGVLAPSRAMDWSQAGVPGGIPSGSWSQCGSTVAAGATSATINAAIAACAANHYVQLAAGTFTLSAGIDFAGRSNVAIRGMGADQTFLVFTGGNGCHGGYGAAVDICIYSSDGNWSGGTSNSANWTAGYAQGSTTITLSSVSNLKVGNPIILDQVDDASDTGGIFVCQSTSASPPCSLEGDNGPVRPNRDQTQIVVVTSCDGNSTVGHACSSGANIGITPGLYMPNWSSSHSPGAWWATNPIKNVGIENMSLDHTKASGDKGIAIYDCVGCWVAGVRSIDSGKAHVEIGQSAHTTVQNNYLYLTQSSMSQSYGIESANSADDLYVNNIIQYVASPIMQNGPCTGCVIAYNFATNNYFEGSGYNIPGVLQHLAGIALILYEGNSANAITGDNFHGTHNLITIFRNAFPGWQPSCYAGTANTFAACNNALTAVDLRAYSRYYNLVGNVLGHTGTQTGYTTGSQPLYIIGNGNNEGSVTVPADSMVGTTLLRWGNYDTVNAAVRWVASEVPSGLSALANPVPASQTLPASFFLTAKPSWWPASKPWPAIGPDVTGGNVTGVAGHVYTLPAQDCYLNVMHGPSDGTGAVLSFNADTCYSTASSGGGSGPNLSAPMTATVQ